MKKISLNIDYMNAILLPPYEQKSGLEGFCKQLDLSHIPPMERRRLRSSAKALFFTLKDWKKENMPIIYSSNFGEINHCFELLKNLASDDTVSPTAFSLSVLNSTPALFAIAHQNHSEIIAISSEESLEYALINAYTKLQESPKVLVIVYNESIMQPYYKNKSPIFNYAIALSVSKGNSYQIYFEPSIEKTHSNGGREFLKHFGVDKKWEYHTNGKKWVWEHL